MAEYLFADLDPVLPSEWRAQVDYLSTNLKPWSPDKTVVHYGGNAVTDAYTGEAREKTVLRIYEQSHLSRGWTGLAYNYAIGMSGRLYVIRAEQRSGATSGDYEDDGIPENEEARAVLFIMGGDQEPTDEALDTFTALWERTPEAQELVIGHRDVKGTTQCPGDFLTNWIHEEQYKEAEMPDSGFSDPAFEPAFNELVEAGVFTEHTKPQDILTAEKFAQFFSRAKSKDYFATTGPQGPQGEPGKDATVEVFLDGEPL